MNPRDIWDKLPAIQYYEVLPTDTLEFLHAFCLTIHHAGFNTKESKLEFRAMFTELQARKAELEAE